MKDTKLEESATNKGGISPITIGFFAVAGIGLVFLISNSKSTVTKRKEIIDYLNAVAINELDRRAVEKIQIMTESEIDYVHDFIFNYVKKNINVPNGSPLILAIDNISKKYGIFG